jgi:hypothetical protein
LGEDPVVEAAVDFVLFEQKDGGGLLDRDL